VYAYDGLDRVAARNSTPFAYAGVGWDPVADGTQRFSLSPAGRLQAVASAAGAGRLVVANRHGDLRGLLDPTSGALTDSVLTDPFGVPLARTGSFAPRVGFQGDWTEPVSGDTWMGARWYTPGTGTFRSRDTVYGLLTTPVSLNRYTYAHNNPITYWDPDGRRAIDGGPRDRGWRSPTKAMDHTYAHRVAKNDAAKQERVYRQRRERRFRAEVADIPTATNELTEALVTAFFRTEFAADTWTITSRIDDGLAGHNVAFSINLADASGLTLFNGDGYGSVGGGFDTTLNDTTTKWLNDNGTTRSRKFHQFMRQCAYVPEYCQAARYYYQGGTDPDAGDAIFAAACNQCDPGYAIEDDLTTNLLAELTAGIITLGATALIRTATRTATQTTLTTTDNLGNLGRGATEAVPGIKTPYGVADQGTDAGSIVLRGQVETGGTVYRQGVTGTQQTADGQFWAGQNPALTPGYANSYGTPGTQVAQGEYAWIMGGTVEPGTPFVTRGAPGIGTNLGGAPEVVVNPGGVRNLWFHMPD
jgi:RHS repeat-associated protein